MLVEMAKPLAKLVALLTPKRRWAQFSLATMFVVVTVLCVSLSVVVNRAHRQRDAVAAIEALGGRVYYVKPDQNATEAFPRRFLRSRLPRDYFDEVRYVDFWSTFDLTDAGLARLQDLTGLQELRLGGPEITDAGLAYLHRLPGLQYLRLYLSDTQVTDAGLAHLRGLTGLQVLHLDGTQVTDAGLPHLQGLSGLKSLNLSSTQVTGVGLAHLDGLTALQVLDLGGTQVTDAGLAHLQGLTGLQELHLDGTPVTDAGMAHLQGLASLRRLSFSRTQVTDTGLAQLQVLTRLEWLWLKRSQVTDAALAQFRQALPNCRINGLWPVGYPLGRGLSLDPRASRVGSVGQATTIDFPRGEPLDGP